MCLNLFAVLQECLASILASQPTVDETRQKRNMYYVFTFMKSSISQMDHLDNENLPKAVAVVQECLQCMDVISTNKEMSATFNIYGTMINKLTKKVR